MPTFAEKSSPMAYYDAGTADGSRPGRVDVNLYNFAERSLATVESVAYHEGIPGHHLQISIAQELTGLPEFRKYQDYTAFVEGWALYSETTGQGHWILQGPLQRLRPAGQRHVAGDSAGSRYGRALAALDAAADGGLLP